MYGSIFNDPKHLRNNRVTVMNKQNGDIQGLTAQNDFASFFTKHL